MTNSLRKNALRIAMITCLVILTACGPSVTTKSLSGEWRCESENPNGGTSRELWEFKDNGIYAIRASSNGAPTYIDGNYVIDGKKIDQTVVTVAVGNYRDVKNTGKTESTLTVQELKEKSLKFESTVLKSGNKRQFNCQR